MTAEQAKTFIHRNYTNIMENRQREQEEKWMRPKYLESETHFVPKISKNSKKLTEDRGEGEVFKNLFQEAVYFNDKKQGLRLEKQKQMKLEEMKGVTFKPEISKRKRNRLSKYIDPK